MDIDKKFTEYELEILDREEEQFGLTGKTDEVCPIGLTGKTDEVCPRLREN